MKLSKPIVNPLWVALLCFFIFSFSPIIAKEKKQEKVPPQKENIIPPEIGKIFDENVITKKSQRDIPITYIRTLYLPSRDGKLYAIFLFKMKNSDLDFQEKMKSFEIVKSEQEEAEVVEEKLLANLNVFIRFYKMEEENIKEITKEIYLPTTLEEKKDNFDPEQENIYTIAYLFTPGKYLLALAVTTEDLSKIGTSYTEFVLPDPFSFLDKLETTPIFFVKSIKRVPSPETVVKMHKNSFFYSILEMEPKIENVFSPTATLDIFYYIFGAKLDPETKKYNIEIKYSIKKDEEEFIKFTPQISPAPLISQPLPLSSLERKLEPGLYVLNIQITDNISEMSTKKEIPFEVK